MEQRLVDLRKPPVDINAALGIPPPAAAKADEMVLTDEVKKNAKDLTGLVRKKRKAEEGPVGTAEGEAAGKKVREGEGHVDV
jgi:HAT1-interacting factor 1